MSKFTELETRVLKAFIAESIGACGDFGEDGNLSYMSAKDLSKELGLSMNVVGGVMTSLMEKRAIFDTGESARGAKWNDFVADEANPDVAELAAPMLV